VFVRHGETEFIVEGRFQGQAETPLSAVGERQAALTAARLARPHASPALPIPTGPPVEIAHSPLARAADTARAIEEAMAGASSFAQSIERRPEPGLLEIGQGSWEGLLTTEIEARWGDVLGTWRRRPLDAWAPGGESIPEVQARLRPGLAGILARLAAAGADRAPSATTVSQVAGYREPLSDRPWSVVVGHDGVFKVALLTLFDLPLERFWMWSFDLCGIGVVEFRGGLTTPPLRCRCSQSQGGRGRCRRPRGRGSRR